MLTRIQCSFTEIEKELSRPAPDVLLDLTSMSDYSLGDVGYLGRAMGGVDRC